MSPVSRRWWKKGVLVDAHQGYRHGAKIVADKLNVHFVDNEIVDSTKIRQRIL